MRMPRVSDFYPAILPYRPQSLYSCGSEGWQDCKNKSREKNYPATPQNKCLCGFAGIVAGWQDNFPQTGDAETIPMKSNTKNDDGHRHSDDAEIRIPNSPVFARLELERQLKKPPSLFMIDVGNSKKTAFLGIEPGTMITVSRGCHSKQYSASIEFVHAALARQHARENPTGRKRRKLFTTSEQIRKYLQEHPGEEPRGDARSRT